MARIRGSYGRPTFLDVWIPTRIALGSKPRWKYNLQAEKADVYAMPPLQDILCARIQNQPPKCFLVALLNMCKTSGDAIALVEHFPAALHVQTQTAGEEVQHRTSNAFQLMSAPLQHESIFDAPRPPLQPSHNPKLQNVDALKEALSIFQNLVARKEASLLSNYAPSPLLLSSM